MNKQIELDPDLKAIQQIEFVGQLQDADDENADSTQSMFVLAIFKSIKEMRLRFSWRSITFL